MTIDTRTPITTFTGEPVHDATGPVTFGTVMVAALLGSYADEQPSVEEKLWRYNLARRLHEASAPIALNAEEAALIRRLVGKAYGAVVVGPIHAALEN